MSLTKTLKIMALFAFAIVTSVFAQAQQFNSCVENEGADISVTLPTSFNTANANLPDPFLMLNGERITAKEQWKQRRQELLKLLERTVYGTKPAKPATVTGTVTKTSISVNAGGGSFSISVTMPSDTGRGRPYPLVIRYDSSGVPINNFTSNGVAVANFNTASVGGGTRAGKTGAFYTANPNNKTTGHLAAWAWGVSRIIDVIEADPNKLFDPTKIGVTGCSRDGKGAFTAGVLDQRVALTMPMESGTGGMASMRVAYNNRDPAGGTDGSQSPSAAYGEQPWLGDDFSTFQNNPNNLPIDMHEAVVLVAPRGFLAVYKTAASAGKWLNVPGSHVSAVSGAEVYKALGHGGNFGWLNTGTESHCMWTTAYSSAVKDFIDMFLHRTKTVTATAPLFTENNRPATAASMKNWETPTLSGTLTVGCVPAGPPPVGCILVATASPSSGGAINKMPVVPASGRYDTLTNVTLTAVAAQGYEFDGWAGDTSSAANPISITMTKSMNITAKFLLTGDDPTNLIKDGNFPGNALTSNWQWNVGANYGGSAGTNSVNGGKVTLNVTTPGDSTYQPQLIQQGISLEQGSKYRLTFTASAATARDLHVSLQQSVSPWSAYVEKKSFELTPSEYSYKLEFEMTAASDPNTQLSFNVGGAGTAGTSAVISDVKLNRIAKIDDGTAVCPKFSGASIVKNNRGLTVKRASNSALNVNFTAKNGGNVAIKLYSLKGNLISATKLQTVSGANCSHTFNIGNMSAGLYVIKIVGDGFTEQTRVTLKR